MAKINSKAYMDIDVSIKVLKDWEAYSAGDIVQYDHFQFETGRADMLDEINSLIKNDIGELV